MSIGADWPYLLASVGFFALLQWSIPAGLSPDGSFYMLPIRHRPRVYAGRWLLPLLLGQRFLWWRVVSGAALLGTALLLGPAGPLYLGLACSRTNTRFPVLTDQLGMFCLALALVTGDWRWAAIGGAVNEKAPVFGAALLLSPLPLLGLALWLPGYLLGRGPSASDDVWLAQPLQAGRAKLDESLNLQSLVLPWGGAVVGLVGVPVVAVALAYAQVVVAHDRARLYQWIAPAVCLATVTLAPAWLYLPLLMATWANPYRRVL